MTEFDRKKRDDARRAIGSVAVMKTTRTRGDDTKWRAVVERDAAADGTFVFAVRTTKIHCRPSCGARRPKRTNVVFFASSAAAAANGYRACKRCRPDGASPARERDRIVQQVCRRIESAEKPPTLRELASFAGSSPFHLQRVFRAAMGLSPRDYAAAVRARRTRSALRTERTVTAAAFAAGYESTSRFHAEARRELGMSAGRYRANGAGERIRFGTAACSLGVVLAAATERGICAIHLGDDASELESELRERFVRAEFVAADAAFSTTLAQVVALVDGRRPTLDLPLDVRGTVFQRRVWRVLLEVPLGTTIGYRELARRIGAPRAARAVAGACAQNAIAVAVPCHRVVRSDGSTSGYRWGEGRKRALLDREKTNR